MKKLFLIIGFVGLSLVFTMASEAGENIQAVLDSSDGTSYFAVRSSVPADVATISSLGKLTLYTQNPSIMRYGTDGSLELWGASDYGLCSRFVLYSNATGNSSAQLLLGNNASAKFYVEQYGEPIVTRFQVWSQGGVRVGSTATDPGANNLVIDGKVGIGTGTASPQEALSLQVGQYAATYGNVRVTGDDVAGYWETEANPSWELNRDVGGGGKPGIGLGPGGATAYDTKIFRSSAYTLQTSAYGLYKDVDTSSLNVGGGTNYDTGGGVKFIADSITGGSTTGVELYLMSGRTFEIMQNSGSWPRTLKAWGGGGVMITDDTGTNTDPGAKNLAVEGTINIGEITGTATVTTPTAGNTIYSRLRAGRRLLGSKGPSGIEYPLQPAIFTNKIGWWSAQGSGTVVSTLSFGHSTTGTATARTISTTNLFTSMRRIGFVTSTAANAAGGTRHALAQFWRGNAAGLGGFYYVTRFGISQTQTNMRWFVGLYGTVGTIAANPTTLFNIIGVGVNPGGTTVWFMTNDASETATTIDLGADFPATTAATDMYEFRLFCPTNSTAVAYYSLENLSTGKLSDGSVGSNLPVNTTLLSPQIWVSTTTGTVTGPGIDIVSQYIETDN